MNTVARPNQNKFETDQYEVMAYFPHNVNAFTEGLEFHDGILYESTGLCGTSGLRRVELHSGRVLQEVLVEEVCNGEDCLGTGACFAEGLTILNGRVFQLTWKSQKGFIYNAADLKKVGEFTYQGEGWGLTHDGKWLIMSNGSHQIQFLDPVNFNVVNTIDVTYQGKPLASLNELEYVKGEIYANIYTGPYGHFIARIHPKSGTVVGMIDLTKISRRYMRNGVLNGVTYDEKRDRLFITGKMWPKLFEIRLKS